MRSKIKTLIAVPVMFFVSFAARADFLDVTVTGTVLSDSDMSNFFGFGVSPSPTGQSTAAGQPVTMNFVLDLNRIPTDCGSLPPPVGFGDPNRADYFTNSVPASTWVTWTASIGGKVVPEIPFNEESQFASDGQKATAPAEAMLWKAYGNLPLYNEFYVERDQFVETLTPVAPGTVAFSDVLESSDLRIDSVTTPF
jgi:hypothetical protein